MSQAQFLADRLKEACLDGKFIANTNIKSQIQNITWLQANQKIESLNTVALLTYHLNYYLRGILDFIKTNKSYGTYKRNIMAVIEHSYYHFGQISLIRKLIISKESSL